MAEKPISYHALCWLSVIACIVGVFMIFRGFVVEIPRYSSYGTTSTIPAELTAEAIARKANLLGYGTYTLIVGVLLGAFASVVGMLNAILHELRMQRSPTPEPKTGAEAVTLAP